MIPREKCKICSGKVVLMIKGLFDDRHGYPKIFNVKRCVKCGFGQTYPQLRRREIAKLYENFYPWKKADISRWKIEDYKVMPKEKLWRKGLLINGQYWVRKGSDVLDVGCGLGQSLLELKNLKCKGYGIDPDSNGVRVAKKFGLKFFKGFIEDKPFKGKSFDYVIANQVLEHTNDPIGLLKACKARLKTDGRIIMAFPNLDSLSRKILGRSWLHWHIPYHLNFFTRDSAVLAIKKAGLRVVKLKTITPNMWTNLQLRRLLQEPRRGIRDTFWDGGQRDEGIKNNFFTNALNTVLAKMWALLEEWNYFNRLIDWFGGGDSFLVICEREKN